MTAQYISIAPPLYGVVLSTEGRSSEYRLPVLPTANSSFCFNYASRGPIECAGGGAIDEITYLMHRDSSEALACSLRVELQRQALTISLIAPQALHVYEEIDVRTSGRPRASNRGALANVL
jgi:hypothetical protein